MNGYDVGVEVEMKMYNQAWLDKEEEMNEYN